ncbi:hypothetical protein LTR09_006266 [Extremus antarcticus]|uniref:Protein kinase domain-containing protein n=1 Tax=Extremus antarcticus TaxID=702011 RepID=A0AAJ0GDK0_9PEZI|nr:hypothetical protein LTR09_006266 [Extremus antarcticus]
MEYETPDGSQFSLRSVRSGPNENGNFEEYTSVSAIVDGIAYAGRLNGTPDEVDQGDMVNSLQPVPAECIHPPFQEGFTVAPTFDSSVQYLKAPSFTYDDCQPGKTFVADCVLNEVKVLERLKASPHPNIVVYHGCVVKNGRITHLCLQRYPYSLADYVGTGLDDVQYNKILRAIKEGILHLHSLGLAHNDLNAENVLIDADREPIIIDFDSCLPLGEPLLKGTGTASESQPPISSAENDLVDGLQSIDDFLQTEGRR